jgi:hypothetical protein
MTSRKPKTGRRANNSDREIAKEWAELYRQAQQQPNGLLCLNPSDNKEEQTWLDGNCPNHLIHMLERFAEHGTFAQVGGLFNSIRHLPLRMEFKKRREGGESYEKAIADMADKYSVSTRTMERRVRTDKS